MNVYAFQPAYALKKGKYLFALCKPRVNALIVFTAMIGMCLSTVGWPPLGRFVLASLGIALVAMAAAAMNCLVERTADAIMVRTQWRRRAHEECSAFEISAMAFTLGVVGLWLLGTFINMLTMWLTLATFFGYAIVYTLILKPATPMNIVIGGASGAMPPILGWTAMTGRIDLAPLALFLIIFLWTPPHFWALACYRRDDYARAGFPMLPVTHGLTFTCQHIFLYTLMLAAASLIPVSLAVSGVIYLVIVSLLDLGFLYLAWQLMIRYDDMLAKKTFYYSIIYLMLLFAALFIDRAIDL